jgi:hypothetical protein
VGATAPAFTDADVEEVGKLLVEGRVRLPTHARVTVITEVETIKSKVFGSSEVFTHTATSFAATSYSRCPFKRPLRLDCW